MEVVVPFNDLRGRFAADPDDYRAAFERVMARGYYILGPEVEAFETELSAALTVNHAIGVASGTDAIELALRAAGIGPGDEVITVAHTAFATVAAILRVQATPIFVDIDPFDYCMDVRAVPSVISSRSRAILVVHLYGQPASLQPLRDLADRHGLLLIEDCAQAFGGRYRGSSVGTYGHLAAFSFYPTKNLGAFGDAGAVVTNDDGLADRIRRLRNYGQSERYRHVEGGGINSRLDELQAAMLRVALRRFPLDLAERRRLADRYLRRLRYPSLPCANPGTDHAYHLFVIRVPQRDAFRADLRRHGIETLVHYPIPVHLQPCLASLGYRPGALPETERAAQEVVSLPLYPGLATEQLDFVAAVANAVDQLDIRPIARPQGRLEVKLDPTTPARPLAAVAPD